MVFRRNLFSSTSQGLCPKPNWGKAGLNCSYNHGNSTNSSNQQSTRQTCLYSWLLDLEPMFAILIVVFSSSGQCNGRPCFHFSNLLYSFGCHYLYTLPLSLTFPSLLKPSKPPRVWALLCS